MFVKTNPHAKSLCNFSSWVDIHAVFEDKLLAYLFIAYVSSSRFHNFLVISSQVSFDRPLSLSILTQFTICYAGETSLVPIRSK